jgi:hypothetical protein
MGVLIFQLSQRAAQLAAPARGSAGALAGGCSHLREGDLVHQGVKLLGDSFSLGKLGQTPQARAKHRALGFALFFAAWAPDAGAVCTPLTQTAQPARSVLQDPILDVVGQDQAAREARAVMLGRLDQRGSPGAPLSQDGPHGCADGVLAVLTGHAPDALTQL